MYGGGWSWVFWPGQSWTITEWLGNGYLVGAYLLFGTFEPWGGFGHGAVTRFSRFHPVD